MEKEEVRRVNFQIGSELKEEIENFAHSLNISSSDFYKAGAVLLKNLLEGKPEVTLNLFTKNFKDLERGRVKSDVWKISQDTRRAA